MKLEVTIGNQQLTFLAVFLTALLIVGLAGAYGGASPTTMGHSGGEVDVTIGGSLKTIQQAIDNGDLSNGNIACPSGFTSIEKTVGGVKRQLGCMQTSPNTADECWVAIQTCFSTYGGRLPTFGEASVAFNPSNGFGITITFWHWISQVAGTGTGGYCFGIGTDLKPTYSNPTSAGTYRCWIPR